MDIRKIKSLEQLREILPLNTRPLDAIRLKCLDCSCYDWKEVGECNMTDCPLHPFRLGKNPFDKRNFTPEEREKRRQRLLTK